MLRVTVGPTPCIDAALLSVRRPVSMLRVTVGPTPCINAARYCRSDARIDAARYSDALYRCCALLSVRLPVSMLCYCRWLISRVQCSVSVVSTLVTSSVHWGQECSLTVTLETVLMRLLQVTMHSCESWFILITSSPS